MVYAMMRAGRFSPVRFRLTACAFSEARILIGAGIERRAGRTGRAEVG
jgi:hypothetical protein